MASLRSMLRLSSLRMKTRILATSTNVVNASGMRFYGYTKGQGGHGMRSLGSIERRESSRPTSPETLQITMRLHRALRINLGGLRSEGGSPRTDWNLFLASVLGSL